MRRQQNPNSWQQQSGQTGGNVMMNQGNDQRRFQPSGRPAPQKQMEEAAYLDISNRYIVPGFKTEVFN